MANHRLVDRDGITFLLVGDTVQIVHPNHTYTGCRGKVIEIRHVEGRVLIELELKGILHGDPIRTWAGHRSVVVL